MILGQGAYTAPSGNWLKKKSSLQHQYCYGYCNCYCYCCCYCSCYCSCSCSCRRRRCCCCICCFAAFVAFAAFAAAAAPTQQLQPDIDYIIDYHQQHADEQSNGRLQHQLSILAGNHSLFTGFGSSAAQSALTARSLATGAWLPSSNVPLSQKLLASKPKSFLLFISRSRIIHAEHQDLQSCWKPSRPQDNVCFRDVRTG